MARISRSTIEGMSLGTMMQSWANVMDARFHGMITTMAQRRDVANVVLSCFSVISAGKTQNAQHLMHFCVEEIRATASRFVVVVVVALRVLKVLSAEEPATLRDREPGNCRRRLTILASSPILVVVEKTERELHGQAGLVALIHNLRNVT